MSFKEAKARIKINVLLEESGWRLLDGKEGKANVVFENHVRITQKIQDEWGKILSRQKMASLTICYWMRKDSP